MIADCEVIDFHGHVGRWDALDMADDPDRMLFAMDRAGIDMAGTASFLWLEVDDVVRETLADIAKNKIVIIPGLQYKALTTGGRMIPRNVVRALTRVVGKGRDRT